MDKSSSIFVAGHRGLVGAALLRSFQNAGYKNLLTATRAELDLQRQAAVEGFFSQHRPAVVVLAAAKVGGIWANATYSGDFARENLLIQTNVIDAAFRNGCQRFVFLGSSCIYPKLAEQPIREESLLSGPLEPTNDAYAVAKIAGVKMCQAYRRQYGFDAISLMPTNLYGPNDNFDPQNSHVLPGLMRKFHEAKLRGDKELVVWGTGTPRRELMHVDDLAAAVLHILSTPSERVHATSYEGLYNVGTGTDVTIRELAELVARVVGTDAPLRFDTSKPDGTPRKQLDVSRLQALGFAAKITLEEGVAETYEWYRKHHGS